MARRIEKVDRPPATLDRCAGFAATTIRQPGSAWFEYRTRVTDAGALKV
jgi:hypothetical protein